MLGAYYFQLDLVFYRLAPFSIVGEINVKHFTALNWSSDLKASPSMEDRYQTLAEIFSDRLYPFGHIGTNVKQTNRKRSSVEKQTSID